MNPEPRADSPADAAPVRPPLRLVALVAAAVLALAALGYWRTGMPDYAERAAAAEAELRQQAHASGNPHDAEQLAEMVGKLEQHLKNQPDDGDGWMMLGRAHAMLGQAEPAITAYRRAVTLRGDDPRVLTDLAELIGVTQGHTLAGEPTELLSRALALAPRAPKTLALAGAAAFDRKDYATAVKHWEALLAASPSDANFTAQLRDGIAEARKLGGLPPAGGAAAPALAAAPATPATPAAPATAAVSASVSGTVTLAPALAGRAAPGDTLFVFARAADGPRMPLALLRKQVKDLPLTFTLDDAMSMQPQLKLSSAGKVVVVARISKSGNATPQPGDLSGQSEPVALGATGVRVLIADVAP